MLCSCSKGELERTHQGSSLIESVELSWEKTWKVGSASFAICACYFSCFLANLICQSLYFLASPCASWDNLPFQLDSCLVDALQPLEGWVKARFSLHLGALYPMGMGGNEGTSSGIGSERRCSSSELFHRVSWKKGYIFNSSSPPPIVGPPWCWSKGVSYIYIASPVGILQMKHPRECGHV